MIGILRLIFRLLSSTERKAALTCFAAMLLMAFFDVIGVASIMPFMAVIADPDAITHHKKLAWLYQHLHFANPHQFLIFLGLLVLSILIIGNSVSMFTSWSILKFTAKREYSLSKRLFIQYLYQPYVFFLNRNTAELSKNILSEVTTVINRAFIPGMLLIAKSIVTVLILSFLLFIDPVLAFVVGGILGGAYFWIYMVVRKRLATISHQNVGDKHQKYKIVTECFNGIKEIKLLGREAYFLSLFSQSAKQLADDESQGSLIAQLPRYALETLAFGGVLVITIYLLIVQQNIQNAIPLLALYAFASFRLMPALQQIFTSLAFLRVSREALVVLSHDLHHPDLIKQSEWHSAVPKKSCDFKKAITLSHLSFTYPGTDRKVIQDINLTIPINSTVGFVGMTGAGKTTLIDLLLGLLTPSAGEIYIDDIPLSLPFLNSWQEKIGYVPQHIYLSDDTIACNIAWGIPPDRMDYSAIEQAAKIANLHHFITTELKDGYQTIVGDRGIRLSGGQRQRIGIARALYHNPGIIVLDEATNALDNMTESIIMEAIAPLTHQKTIMMVAHKLSTLKECDEIFILEQGRLYASGKYDALIAENAKFRDLAGTP